GDNEVLTDRPTAASVSRSSARRSRNIAARYAMAAAAPPVKPDVNPVPVEEIIHPTAPDAVAAEIGTTRVLTIETSQSFFVERARMTASATEPASQPIPKALMPRNGSRPIATTNHVAASATDALSTPPGRSIA